MIFLPLKDDNPHRYIAAPVVTWVLIAVNLAIFAAMLPLSPQGVQMLDLGFGVIPALVTDQANIDPAIVHLPSPLTLVSYMFLHGGFMHIIGNMLFLFVFGDNVEDAMGHLRFSAFYLACGIVAGLVHVAFMPGSQTPLVGASGAISAIIGAYLMLYPRAKVFVLAFKVFPLTLPVWAVLGSWVLLQIFNLLTLGEDNVAWTAHVGGFAAGVLLVKLMKRRDVLLFGAEQRLKVSVPQIPLAFRKPR